MSEMCVSGVMVCCGNGGSVSEMCVSGDGVLWKWRYVV